MKKSLKITTKHPLCIVLINSPKHCWCVHHYTQRFMRSANPNFGYDSEAEVHRTSHCRGYRAPRTKTIISSPLKLLLVSEISRPKFPRKDPCSLGTSPMPDRPFRSDDEQCSHVNASHHPTTRSSLWQHTKRPLIPNSQRLSARPRLALLPRHIIPKPRLIWEVLVSDAQRVACVQRERVLAFEHIENWLVLAAGGQDCENISTHVYWHVVAGGRNALSVLLYGLVPSLQSFML